MTTLITAAKETIGAVDSVPIMWTVLHVRSIFNKMEDPLLVC